MRNKTNRKPVSTLRNADSQKSAESEIGTSDSQAQSQQSKAQPLPQPTRRGGIYDDDDDEVCVNGVWDWES